MLLELTCTCKHIRVCLKLSVFCYLYKVYECVRVVCTLVCTNMFTVTVRNIVCVYTGAYERCVLVYMTHYAIKLCLCLYT